MADDIMPRLQRASMGSCNCHTKTPSIEFHSPFCHYRLHQEAMDQIRAMRETLMSIADNCSNVSRGEETLALFTAVKVAKDTLEKFK